MGRIVPISGGVVCVWRFIKLVLDLNITKRNKWRMGYEYSNFMRMHFQLDLNLRKWCLGF